MKDTCLVSARLDEVYFKSLLSEITSLFLTLAHSVSLVLISDKILLPLKVQESIVIHLNELRMSCLLFSSSGSVCLMFSYLCEIFFSVSLSEGHSNTFILFIWTSKAYEYSYPLNKVSAALWNQRGECYFLFLVQVCYLLQLLWDNSLGRQECPSCCHALVSSQCHQKGASGLILGQIPCADKAGLVQVKGSMPWEKMGACSMENSQCPVLSSWSHNSISLWHFKAKIIFFPALQNTVSVRSTALM